jgi:hypothetical protein
MAVGPRLVTAPLVILVAFSPADTAVSTPPLRSRWQQLFAGFVRPAVLLQQHVQQWPLAGTLGIPVLAFVLWFLQTAVDLGRAGGGATGSSAMLAVGAGIVAGLILVPSLAALVWGLTRPLDVARTTLSQAVRAFSLAYFPALLYAACGLVVQLTLGWPTALAFGVAGVLWTLSPLLAVVREMSGDRPLVAASLTTLCGLVVLMAWATVGLGMPPSSWR